MTGNLTAQAGTMKLAGAPNDIIQNLNPISIIIMIPILDHVVYPGFRKIGINLSPIRRMTVGYFFAAAAMVAAAVMQHYIYKLSPCGMHASDEGCEAPILVWAQCVPVCSPHIQSSPQLSSKIAGSRPGVPGSMT